ncbi:coiled-coil domain-containing protein [Brochothrix thermosphacta]|uniref:coiled-coil domain-containing protein n=1 Tax=Brochothrix thermosphacta TaxID=2756 RepID=UPI00083FCEA4|nr:hypothetical protein [Brochothrix thermosphacta]ODJ64901.1 hypothetical protein BFR36_09755 [Brochothrix thermosphacta]SOC32628.1 conserved exported protein of unknown function [Brochothrix thermosphacta]
MNLNEKKKFKRTKFSKGKQYLLTLFIFFVAIIAIMISPNIMGKDYNYDSINLNEEETLGADFSSQVTDVTYNPSKNLIKLSFKYIDRNPISRLSNLNLKYQFKYINDQKNAASSKKVKEIKVSDEYVVVYLEGVPEKFGVVSVSIEPVLAHAKDDEKKFNGSEWKFYIVEDKVKIDENMKEMKGNELVNEGVEEEIKEVDKEISDVNGQINDLQIEIDLTKKEIKSKENDLDFLTAEEKQESESDINSMKSSILSSENRINEFKERIGKYKQKIELLRTKMVK